MHDVYDDKPLGLSTEFEIVRFTPDGSYEDRTTIATEIPLTILANDVEIATLMASPSDIENLCFGFLFSSGFVNTPDDIRDFMLNDRKWRADVSLSKTPTPEILNKRLYTSGCGKGVMFPSITAISARKPLDNDFRLDPKKLFELMGWFLRCSELHRETHGVHTAALSVAGDFPEQCFDDVGRHNAVDKVLGDAFKRRVDLRQCIMISTGRVSSEILHKAKRCGIPIVVSLGSPTHQSILLAQEMNVTLVGFARKGKFTVFSAADRFSGKRHECKPGTKLRSSSCEKIHSQ